MVEQLKYIDRLGKIHEQDPGRWSRFWDRFKGPFAGRRDDENRDYKLTFWIYLLLEPLIIDHAPLNYTNRIWNCYSKDSDF